MIAQELESTLKEAIHALEMLTGEVEADARTAGLAGLKVLKKARKVLARSKALKETAPKT